MPLITLLDYSEHILPGSRKYRKSNRRAGFSKIAGQQGFNVACILILEEYRISNSHLICLPQRNILSVLLMPFKYIYICNSRRGVVLVGKMLKILLHIFPCLLTLLLNSHLNHSIFIPWWELFCLANPFIGSVFAAYLYSFFRSFLRVPQDLSWPFQYILQFPAPQYL